MTTLPFHRATGPPGVGNKMSVICDIKIGQKRVELTQGGFRTTPFFEIIAKKV